MVRDVGDGEERPCRMKVGVKCQGQKRRSRSKRSNGSGSEHGQSLQDWMKKSPQAGLQELKRKKDVGERNGDVDAAEAEK